MSTDTKDGLAAAVPVDEASPDGVVSNSRRSFLTGPLAGVAVLGTAVALQGKSALAANSCPPDIVSVRVPKDFTDSLAQAPKEGTFTGKGMSGAEVFAKLCKDENLAVMFCAPGNYTVIHAMAAAGVPSYGGRTEGGMAAAADGFYRASGEVVACSGTEGPGFTNMIGAIAAASFARTPLLVLASNAQISGEDREAFIQNMYQQPITTGIKKYGKRIISPNRVHEYGAYAFRNLKSGVPGPVHLDFPGEVARARFTDSADLTDYYDKTRYRTESRAIPTAKDVLAAVDMITKAQRPLVIAGHGVFHRKAWGALLLAAEKNEFAVVVSGPMRGHFPDDHRLSMNLSPDALMSADLVVFIGQYSMPSHTDWRISPDAKTIRVHPVPEELGRNLELGIVGDEAAFLEALADAIPSRKRDAWVGEVASARKAYIQELDSHYALGLKYSRNNVVHPAVIGKEIYEFLYNGSIDPKQTVTGWGGNTCIRFVPPRLRANRAGQSIVTPYQFGAIGPDISVMLGAAVASQLGAGAQQAYKGAPALVMTTDAGMGYSMFELETAVKYKIPLIAVVYNNNAWATWTAAAGSPRSLHIHLFQENIRYDRMAAQLGAHSEHVETPEQLRAALKRSYDVAVRQSLPSLINVRAIKEFSSPTLYPPGPQLNPEPGIGCVMH
jgi:acetolactate synthase I/II/III large subunit